MPPTIAELARLRPRRRHAEETAWALDWRNGAEGWFQELKSPATWTRFEHAFVPSGSGLWWDVFLQAAGPGDVWFDDLALEDLGPASCSGSAANAIANGGFDTSNACWRIYSRAGLPAGVRTDRSGDGPQIEIELSTAGTDETTVVLVQGRLPLAAGAAYRLSFTVTSPDGVRGGGVQMFAEDYSSAYHYASWSTDAPFETLFVMPEAGVLPTSLLEIKLA